SAMGASGEVAAEVGGYNFWWALSLPPLLFSMTIFASVRAHGDALAPAVFLFLIAAINIAAGPFLIFGWFGLPPLGAEGAGAATFLARWLGGAAAFVYVVREGYLTVACARLKGIGSSARDVFSIAAPAAGSNAINPIGMAVVTSAVATLGDAAVAGFGAATRVQAFAVVPLLALSSAIGPMVGQNWGAEEHGRARAAMGSSWLFILGWCAFVAIVFFAFAEPIAALATPDGEALRYASGYLAIVGLTLAGYGLTFVGNAALNARGRPLPGLGVSVLRAFVVYAGGAWALVGAFGYDGVLAAAVAANLVAAAAAFAAASFADIAPKSLAPTNWRFA
ncbi:MAG: MATE family efflux transporter, partial [Pseudomonadota bacterium]